MVTWLLVIGFLSILAQVVLIRELGVAFYGSELVYLLALGVWMLCTALGAASGRRRSRPSMRRVRWTLVGIGPLLVFDVVLVRGAHRFLGGVPGADLPFAQQLLAMTTVLLVVGLPLGLLFRWVAGRCVSDGGTIARAYAIECAGAMVGGAIATLALAAGVQNLASAILGALVASTAAVVPRPRSSPSRGGALAAAALLVLLAATFALVRADRLDAALTRLNHPALIATRDTPYGRVTVTGSRGQIAVFEDGALAFESQSHAAEELAHLAALQHPNPRRALVLGGGVEGLARELERHALHRIDLVELDRFGFELVQAALPTGQISTPAGTAVALHFDDPRRFLERRVRADSTYDLIVVGMPEPASGRTNRFYTLEFFARCADRLAPEGVLALRLRSAENLWTPLLLRRAASIQRSLRREFADVLVLPGATNTLLASRAPLLRDPDPMVARMTARGIRARLVSPAYLRYLYTNDRFFELESRLAATQAPLNEDSRPICYQYTLLLWLSRFHPGLARSVAEWVHDVAPQRGILPWLTVVLIPVVFAWARRRDLTRRAWMVGTAGFVGMVTEGTILLDWQTRSGVLFEDLGILLTLFMAGMVAGTLAVQRWQIASSRTGRDRGPRAPGLLAWVGLAALQLAIVALLRAGALGTWLPGAASLAACGALVGALFAAASLGGLDEPRHAVGSLYAADLAGGCLGALAASLFFLPLLGLAPTALLMACVAASALLLV